MKIGFFLALRGDTQHFLHAASLVCEARQWMPDVDVIQLTDAVTPIVPGVAGVVRADAAQRPLLDLRLSLYAGCEGNWLLVDTDVSVRNDVRGVFDDRTFDVALCDRLWPNVRFGGFGPDGDHRLLTMPYNTGVVFSRSQGFWQEVLDRWRALPDAVRLDWMSEQAAAYDVVRTGRYHVKILAGLAYNYPPLRDGDAPVVAAMVHYKGRRKTWLSSHAVRTLGGVS